MKKLILFSRYLLLGLVLLIHGAVNTALAGGTPEAGNGTGTIVVTPTYACAASTGNSFAFTYTLLSGSMAKSGAQVTITVPTGWTAPQTTNPSNPGYISYTSATTKTLAVTGTWTISVTYGANTAASESFTLSYAGGGTKVTAPATAGVNTFTTKYKKNGGTLTDLTTQPVITVYGTPTISGTLTVCPGSTTQLTGSMPTAGSSWSSGTQGVATVSSAGLVTGISGGTSVITYNTICGSTTATVTVFGSCAPLRNTDLPGPDSHDISAPAGTLVIPMDNTLQAVQATPSYFNLKAYGLVVSLLNNKVPVRWIIKTGKAHDGIDFSANASLLYPTSGSAASRNFSGGPMLIFMGDVPTGVNVGTIINNFNSGLATAAKVNVYQLSAATTVDQRYILSQKPKAAILNDGTNAAIHVGYMGDANILETNDNFHIVASAVNLPEQCYTFASEAHSSAVTANLNAIHTYVENGGNFLAECLAVDTYENNTAGHFYTSNGITIVNTETTTYSYPNSDLSFGQYVGQFDPINIGGAERNWVLNGGTFINNGYIIQSGTGANSGIMGQTAAKIGTGLGHMVFFTGGHQYSGTSIDDINGIRSYLNAYLTPSGLTSCNFLSFEEDISVTKSVDYNPVCSGGNVIFTIAVRHNGPSTNTVTDLTLHDLLPAGLTYVSSTVTQGSYVSGTGIWSVGSLTPYQSAYLTITATAGSAGTYTNKAYIERWKGDYVPDNDTSKVVLTINALPTITGNHSVCAGSTTQLTGSGTPQSPIAWVSASSDFATVDNSGLVSGVAAGASVITYTNSNGCSNTVTVTVNPGPTVDVGADLNPICQGGTSAPLGGSVGGSATGGTWSTTAGGIFSPSATNLNATWTPPSSYSGSATLVLTTSGGLCGVVTDSKNLLVNPLPTPVISGPASTCKGSTDNSYSTPSVSGHTYNWTVSGGTIAGLNTGNSITVTWGTGSSGTVNVTETISATNCSADATSLTVAIHSLPVANAGSNSPVCEGNTLSLSGGPAGMTTYSWTGPNGYTSALRNPTVSSNASSAMAGDYTLTVTDANGCSGSATTNVVVLATPATPSADNDGPICAGSDLHLSTPIVTGGAYSWTGPNGFTSSDRTPTIVGATTAATGTYSVTVTVNSCTSNAGTTVVAVHAIPSSPTAGNNGPLCVGSDLHLTASDISGASYSWTGPGGFTSSAQNPTISTVATSDAGTYWVTATVSGCSNNPASTVVAVHAIPSSPTAGNNGPLCVGSDLHLTASDISGATYSWTGPNGFTSTDRNPVISTVSLSDAGTYWVTATVSGCSSDPASTVVIVHSIPSFTVCPLDITKDPDPNLCSKVITYTATAIGTPVPTLSYTFSGATTGSGIGTGSGSVFNSGTTTVTLTATNSCGNVLCSFNVTVSPCADLQVTKTDGSQTYTPGTTTTYTVVVSNTGPSNVTGATFSDTKPSGVTWSWTSTKPSSGTGNISETVDLASGASITYTVIVTIPSSFTGELVNTATVTPPTGVPDPTPGNNTATDTDTQRSSADLQVTKSDDSFIYTPGTTTTYTVVATNIGPSDVVGATVVDNIPSGITWSYSATGSAGTSGYSSSGTASISDVVTIPSGASITYTVIVTIPSSFTGDLVNTATVTPPTGVTDPTPGNNTATDTDTQSSSADLQVTKTDGTGTYTPGTTTTYTVVVTNAGPSNITGATVSDAIPAGTTWTHTATATGGATGFTTGPVATAINEVVNMPLGSTITYTVVLTIPSGFTGALVNTATVTAPAGVTDPVPGNNTVTDTDTQSGSVDLQITKSDGTTTYTPGTTTTYTVVITNAGPSDIVGATISDAIPAGTTWTRTATATGGATGFTPGPSTAAISDVVTMPLGSTITYTVVLTIPSGFTGALVNTATVATPAGVTDPVPGNNTVTDTDTQSSSADLQMTKSDGTTSYTPGTTTTYTVVVTNAGPSNIVGATISDAIPAGTTWTRTATATGGATGFTPGPSTAAISDVVTMPLGSTITYTVVLTIPSGFTGALVNTATVTAPTGVTDPVPGNNTVTDTDTRSGSADLQVTKSDGSTIYTPGTTTTYTVVISNAGPSNVVGATFVDNIPSGVTWSYSATGSVGTSGYTARGTSNIRDVVTIPAGGTITYMVVVTIPASFTGTLVNTSTITPPASVPDPEEGNNTVTDTDTQSSSANLQIVKSDGTGTYTPGTTTTYTVVVTNSGPSDIIGATVSDAIPIGTTWRYTAAATGGATGFTAGPATTAIKDVVNMPLGSTITYTVVVTIPVSFTGNLINTALVTPPVGVTDPVPGNNSSTDTDVINIVNHPPVIDLPDVNTPGNTPVTICSPITDPDVGDTFTASVCGNPRNGTISTPTISADGKSVCVVYTPALNFSGQDSICIQVCDQHTLCSNSTSKITITLLSLEATPTSVTCFGNKDGMIALIISGGKAPYTFGWTGPNGFVSNAQNLSGLSGGNYQVKVTDANGFVGSTTVTVIEAGTPLTLGVTATPEIRTMSVDGTVILGVTGGSVNLTVTGGTAPYTFVWSGPNNFVASTEDLSDLVSGTYEVNVSDANGCSLTISAKVDIQVVLSEDETCTIIIPNVFTPNGDGIHDYFEISCLYNYSNAEIEIFNRNGNLLYTRDHYGNIDYWGSKDKAFWNGRSENSLNFMGSELPVGTYYYILKLSTGKVYTGFVFLGK